MYYIQLNFYLSVLRCAAGFFFIFFLFSASNAAEMLSYMTAPHALVIILEITLQ